MIVFIVVPEILIADYSRKNIHTFQIRLNIVLGENNGISHCIGSGRNRGVLVCF